MPTRDPSASIVFPSSSLTKGPLEILRGGGVHGLAALDEVLHRDPRVRVPEELGGEERALRVVDDRGDGAAESVRADVADPGRVHHVAQEPADVVRRVRSPDPRAEQELTGIRTSYSSSSTMSPPAARPRTTSMPGSARTPEKSHER